jgi:hypothetical protein
MTRFAQRPDFNSFDIRCIVRSAEKGKEIEALFKNVTVIVGSHSDISLMSKAAAEVDVVIATADCDDVDAATGTLQGMKKRFEETGKKPIFINTSGTGVLADNAAGMYEGETIWDDASPEQMATLQPTQPHRPVDLKIVAADEEGEYLNLIFEKYAHSFFFHLRLCEHLHYSSLYHLEYRKRAFVRLWDLKQKIGSDSCSHSCVVGSWPWWYGRTGEECVA